MSYKVIKERFLEIVKKNGIDLVELLSFKTKCRPLSSSESIGSPKHDDYPLLKGKEILLQSEFKETRGVAFTDALKAGKEFETTLSEVMDLDLSKTQNVPIFISTINAVLGHLQLIEHTEHCKNEELLECQKCLSRFLETNYKEKKILLVGFQPRFVEVVSEFDSKVIDLDKDNIGKKVNRKPPGKLIVEDGSDLERVKKYVQWCDLVLVTSSTMVNSTFEVFLQAKEVIFYGVSGSAVTYLLNYHRFCRKFMKSKDLNSK